MSRIYDALQRARLELTNPQGSEAGQLSDLSNAFDILEPLRTKTEIAFENIARHSWNPSAPSFPMLVDRSDGVEQFRRLRSHLYGFRDEAPLKTILVSSGMPEEGKSLVVANLAMSLAHHTVNKILLIDGDLRRPTLHSLLGAPNAPGLSEYLAGNAGLTEIMQRDSKAESADADSVGMISNLTFIPAGNCDDNSAEFVTNRRFEELITTLSPHFDWILIDSPPVLVVADAVDLARAVDAVLLVARGASTPFDVAQRTKAAFSSSRILGFVLNAVKDAPRGGYYYYSAPQKTSGEAKRRKG